MKVDPITLEVVRGYLVSTVYQMRATLLRTAYAPILYESLDFSCGLMTANGELIAMSDDFAGHVFAMTLGQKVVVEKFRDRIFPGDVLAMNDPYTGGVHLNDFAFYTPFFADGKPLLYIGVRAHFADVGGATPGSFSGQDTEIYQEGVRVTPVKILERGEINRGLWEVILSNMRLQEEREGDALAMLDTGRVAEKNLAELTAKYGPEVVAACVDALLDSAEATMRSRISWLPSAEYYYEQYMDSSGLSAEPVPIKAKLTIAGDEMTFDFTGTSPQVAGPMNCGLPVSRGGAFVIVKSWLDPKTPINAGTFRPLKFVIPPGSCLAAQLPAAVGGCWEVFRQVQSTVVGLFSQLMPEQLGGENLGTSNHIHIAGYDSLRRRHYILYEYPHGGFPATSDTDGANGTSLYDLGDTPEVFPAESVEQRQPLLVESVGLGTDMEGPGRHRSGVGATRRIRVLSDNSQLNVMADRAIIPPWGSAEAYAGSPNAFTVIREGKELQPSPIPGKVKSFPLQHGDVVLMQATGGGGVGDPLTRAPERVQKEVFDGYLGLQRASDVYGVVIEGGRVNLAKTQALRQAITSQRPYFRVVAGASDEFDERGCRICLMGPSDASRIGVRDGSMVEYVGRTTAPLRAWVKLADNLPPGTIPLGPIGRGILKVGGGEEVWVRALNVKIPPAAGRR